MTRKVVVAVDGDTPQAVALLEWAAKNLTLCGIPVPAAKADTCDAVADVDTGNTSGATPAPPDHVGVTILHAMLPSQVPDWGFFPLYQADKLWAGAYLRGGGGWLQPEFSGVRSFVHPRLLLLQLPPSLSRALCSSVNTRLTLTLLSPFSLVPAREF